MFRHVLFNVSVANRDDHPRNHGFIRSPGGWRPAPAYDMNPSTKKDEHVLRLNDSSAVPDLATVMQTAQFYRVSAADAKADLERLQKVLSTWKAEGKALGLSAEDRLELQDCASSAGHCPNRK